MERIGLIAGSGRFPVLFAETARRRGVEVFAVAHRGETDPELERAVAAISWIYPGELDAMIRALKEGGVRRTVDAAAAAVTKLLPAANDLRRTPQPINKLILAENCGGSDGNSGITANPALGVASDELVRYGGTSVLAETPEIYGAEHLLTRRAVTREVGEKLVSFIRWWEDHARQHNATIDNNPSYGNKEGGLTTIYEKSLGAVAKGGQSPLAAVYAYAEPITATIPPI